MASGNEDYTNSTDIADQSIDRISTISKTPSGVAEVFKSAIIINGTTVLHTVTAGKTFYLTSAALALSTISTSSNGYLMVRDGDDISQYYLLRMTLQSTTDNSAEFAYSVQLVPPLEIPAGWDITVFSNSSGHITGGTIAGWEE